MESYGISRGDMGLHIDGFPDAVAFVEIHGPKAKRLGHLALHLADLHLADSFAHRLLDDDHDDVLQTALWHAAIVHFCKCFGSSNGRGSLSSDKIFPSGDPRDAYVYFDRLRDRHLVHDENDYSKALTGAVVGPSTQPYNVERVLALAVTGRTFERGVAQNLVNLIAIAVEYIEEQIESLSTLLTAELEAEGRDALLARSPVSLRVPTLDDV
ncbi:MAG: hypothetical protein JWP14_1302 [Frankiales bacterium]|jgi:hypothetical protein|nr:hypothetical protein [Frankiales bacterium]